MQLPVYSHTSDTTTGLLINQMEVFFPSPQEEYYSAGFLGGLNVKSRKVIFNAKRFHSAVNIIFN